MLILNCNVIDELIVMALSDQVSFESIRFAFGLSENEVKKLMKQSLKPKTYKAWRRRVGSLSKQRGQYKSTRPLQ
ncbi:MAG: TIGR03643 family protein [Proteobacteria bacterium]|nr:TIGR03643 family protein [Pseudomonadota bacterium]